MHIKKAAVRIPQQQRSMKKKEKIIDAGFHLFSENGYFNTDTAEIAKEAGVSTGIVYNYFEDKNAILQEVVSRYIDQLEENIDRIIHKHAETNNLEAFLDDVMNELVHSHRTISSSQNQFIALSLLDTAIHAKFDLYKKGQISKIKAAFFNSSSSLDLYPKIHIAYEIIEKICHLYISQEISSDQFKIYQSLTIQTILQIFKDV